jgi:hypothetical protein
MTCLRASHGQCDIAYFYLILPAQLKEIQYYSYINREFINFTICQCKPQHKLFIPYLQLKENELTAARMACVKLQIEQLKIQRTFYNKPR